MEEKKLTVSQTIPPLKTMPHKATTAMRLKPRHYGWDYMV